MNRTLLVIGLRGSGKSTIGRRVAVAMGTTFIDLDACVMELLGAESVTEIFARLGEPAFRKGERDALERVLREESRAVVALGGGTPTAPGAEALIRAAQKAGEAVAVYLRAQPGEIAERLASKGVGDRPALIDGDIFEEMQKVYDARDAFYCALADHEIDAMRSVDDVVSEIVRALEG